MATIKCVYYKPYCRRGNQIGLYCENYDDYFEDERMRRDYCRDFWLRPDESDCGSFSLSEAQFEKVVKNYQYTGEQQTEDTFIGYLQIGRMKIQAKYIVYLEIDGKVLADYREEEK